MHVKGLPLNKIKPPEIAVRTLADERKFMELRSSLHEHGLIQPIVVVIEGDGYRLAVGDRRLKAAMTLGWETIDAVIADYTPEEMAVIRIHENAEREDPNPVDLAVYLRAQMDRFSWTQGKVAEHCGKTAGWVSQTLKLLELDDATKRMVSVGELSARHGYLAARITKPTVREIWTKHWVIYGTNVSQAEQQVQRWENGQDIEKGLAEAPPQAVPVLTVHYAEQTCAYCDVPLSQRPLVLRPVCDQCDGAIKQGIKMAEEMEGKDG